MKYTLSLFTLLSVAAAAQASTCQTRVDSHPHASTLERIAYCLQEPLPQAQTEQPGVEMVYYGVSSNVPEEPAPVESTVQEGYFEADQLAVARDYVGSTVFPQFRNDTLSEQERQVLERAYLEQLEVQRQAAQAADKKAASAQAPARLTTPAAEQNAAPVAAMSAAREKAGLAARQRKPNRVMKAQPAAEELDNFPQAAPQEQPATYGQDNLLDDNLGTGDEMMQMPSAAYQ